MDETIVNSGAKLRDIRFFMRDTSQLERVVTVPGPPSLTDDNGQPVNLEIKVLSTAAVNAINDSYERRSIALDQKGNPYAMGGEVLFKTERDHERAARHILVEALVYPDLRDKQLMEYYKCYDVTEMPLHVFPTIEEFQYVSRKVMEVLGLRQPNPDADETSIREVKN